MNNERIQVVEYKEEEENETQTGYTLSFFGAVNTGQYGIVSPVQGMPDSLISPSGKRNELAFPDSREGSFIDDRLQEFYKKKGYDRHTETSQ